MLSFSLKAIWFALSLTGLLCCWIVLMAFAHSVNALWGLPLIYCVTVTILEGVFCLGMIWRMDPFLMPKSFCLAQAIVLSFSASILVGICTSLTFAAVMCARRPKLWMHSAHSLLVWRPFYYYTVVAYPTLSTVVYVTVIVKLDAVQPTDDLQCDASNPVWVRLLGYAGSPLLLTIPCFIFSILTAIHVLKSHRHVKSATELNAMEPRASGHALIQLPVLKSMPKASEVSGVAMEPKPGVTSHPVAADQCICPISRKISPVVSNYSISTKDPHIESNDGKTLEELDRDGVEETGSVSSDSDPFPTFAPPSNEDDPSHLSNAESYIDVQPNSRTVMDDPIIAETLGHRDPKATVPKWARLAGLQDKPECKGDGVNGNDVGRSRIRGFSPQAKSSQQICPVSALWRLLLFQTVFFTSICLSSLSTLIDVIKRRPSPTPFGTQHFALLAAVWGPLIVLGHFPGVRQRLRPSFWRKS